MSTELPLEISVMQELARQIIRKIGDVNMEDVPNTNYHELLGNIHITFPLLSDLRVEIDNELESRNNISSVQKRLIELNFSVIFPTLGMESIIGSEPPRKMKATGASTNKATEVLFSKKYRIYRESATEIPYEELNCLCVELYKSLHRVIKDIDEELPALEAKSNRTIEESSEMTKLRSTSNTFRNYSYSGVIPAKPTGSSIKESECSSWFFMNYLTWATELVGLILRTQCELKCEKEDRAILCYDSDDESGNPLNYPMRVDYTIKTSSTGGELEAIAVVEMKSYAVLDFGSKDIIFKKSFHPYFHQLSAYMLLNKVNCGFLSSGLELAYFEFDFSRTIDFDAIPVRFKILDNRSSGVTMRMLLAAVLYKRLNRTEEEKRNELKGLRIFKKTLGNSMEQIIKEIRRCVQEYLITKGLNISQYKLIEIEDQTKVQRLQAGFEYHSQVITIPKTEFLRQFPQDAIDLEALRSSDENIVLKIYDISYTIVACEPNELKYDDILSISRSQCNTESALYNKIRRINQNSDDRIATARVFGVFENLQILVKDKYYFAGDVIAMEELTAKPKTAEDFDKGLQQLRLLHQNGIVHNDVKIDNMFINNENEFVYIDFGFSRSGDLLRSEQLFETDRERMVTDTENWMKTRNKIVRDAADRAEE